MSSLGDVEIGVGGGVNGVDIGGRVGGVDVLVDDVDLATEYPGFIEVF